MNNFIPLEITIRDGSNSKFIEQAIRQKAEKLTRFYNKIEYCKVIIVAQQKHKHQGKLFSTKIELSVPGKRLVVNHKVNENVYITIRDAFNAMQRQVEDYARRYRNYGKINYGNIASYLTMSS